jgi:hypothetical protein
MANDTQVLRAPRKTAAIVAAILLDLDAIDAELEKLKPSDSPVSKQHKETNERLRGYLRVLRDRKY